MDIGDEMCCRQNWDVSDISGSFGHQDYILSATGTDILGEVTRTKILSSKSIFLIIG